MLILVYLTWSDVSSLEGEITQLGHGVTREKWQGGGVVTFVNVPVHFNANGLFMKVVVFFLCFSLGKILF